MLTKRQTAKLVHRMCAHLVDLREVLAGLRAHHATSGAIEPLQEAADKLDHAANLLDAEIRKSYACSSSEP